MVRDDLFSLDDYRLLDFGAGRKLERFGTRVLDRPAPVANGVHQHLRPADWAQADLVFEGPAMSAGTWSGHPAKSPADWTLNVNFATLQLAPRPSGQVGVFPEQSNNWAWILQRSQFLAGKTALNLFAYTGATTLAAAAAGAQVAHVDSAKSCVTQARRNADRSGLSNAPIRWLVDDVPKFVDRELKRGKQYSAIFLDPPSYGHGPRNETWKIERDLPPLLKKLAGLLQSPGMLILTWHTSRIPANQLRKAVETCFRPPPKTAILEAVELQLRDSTGRSLPSGHCIRFSNELQNSLPGGL